MAIFCTIASGSSGNCALLSDKNTHILIDAGISMRRIKNALSGFCLTPEELSAIIITHDHSDHISGLEMMVKYYDVPVYATAATGRRLLQSLPRLRGRLNLFEPGGGFELDEVYINSFRTPHDAAESVGYAISVSSGSVLGFATDLGYVPESVMAALSRSKVLVLEANHDVEMLCRGKYPRFLKERILGEYGHLSNDSCGEAAVRLAQSGMEVLVLAHLSRENNTPGLAEIAVKERLSAAGAVVGRDLRLDVAPAFEPGKQYEL